MSTEQARPLILTARFDEASQAAFDGLRERYFPPERNMIPAHLSLFNQLPADRLQSICPDIEEECSARSRIPARVDGLRFLGKGVAYTLDVPELGRLRGRLAQRWEPWLGPQDHQKLSPHVTVQNKVSAQSAKELYEHLSAAFVPMQVTVEGLSLWRYLGGPWEPMRSFRFGG